MKRLSATIAPAVLAIIMAGTLLLIMTGRAGSQGATDGTVTLVDTWTDGGAAPTMLGDYEWSTSGTGWQAVVVEWDISPDTFGGGEVCATLEVYDDSPTKKVGDAHSYSPDLTGPSSGLCGTWDNRAVSKAYFEIVTGWNNSFHGKLIELTYGSYTWTAPPEWPADVGIYYPLTEDDEWSYYQTFSETTWYGSTYEYYNIWRTRPGAHAFAIAPLYIDDVTINQFGYVVDAHVWSSYWDITSTTVRYEGLASVNVSPGQLIGANCDLGEVAYNTRLYEYQLLLYVTYPTVDSPFNPVPWMTRRPEYGVCLPIGEEELPPSSGTVPGAPLESCYACSVPSSWTEVGRWIIWLECMLSNLYFCHMITWFNMLAGVQVHSLARLVAMGPWLGELYANGLSWLGAFLSGGVDYFHSIYSDMAARVDNLGYIVMSYAGGTTAYIYQEAGTNLWDVLVAFLNLQEGFINMLTALINGTFQVITTLLGLLVDIVQLVIMILAGAISGITTTQGADMVAGATGLDTLDCTQTGVWVTPGPSAGKAACYFLGGVQLLDVVLVATPLAYLPIIIVGVLALGLAYWIMGQFKEIMAT